MKGILNFLLSICAVVSFVCVLFLSTLLLLLLNEKFYLEAFNKGNTYQNLQRGIKLGIEDAILKQITSDESYAKLSLEQKQIVKSQASSYSSILTSSNIKELVEGNIPRTLAYLKGSTDKWIIYVPYQKWNISKELSTQIPEFAKTGEFDLIKLVEDKQINLNLSLLKSLNNSSQNIKKYLLVSILIFLITVSFLLMLGKPGRKGRVLGYDLVIMGVTTILIAWTASFLVNSVGNNSLRSEEAAAINIVFSAIAQPLTAEISKYWFGLSIILLALGLFLASYNKNTINSKKKLKTSN